MIRRTEKLILATSKVAQASGQPRDLSAFTAVPNGGIKDLYALSAY